MDTRDAILDAAWAIYVREGRAGLSMRQVAARVEVSATALYRHFAGKDALIEAVAERGFALFAGELQRGPHARRPGPRVLEVLDRYRDFAFRQPELFRLMFDAPPRRPPVSGRLRRTPLAGVRRLRGAVGTGPTAEFRRQLARDLARPLGARAACSAPRGGPLHHGTSAFAALYRVSPPFPRGLKPRSVIHPSRSLSSSPSR
jgi:AcrR family transcriptional regulator